MYTPSPTAGEAIVGLIQIIFIGAPVVWGLYEAWAKDKIDDMKHTIMEAAKRADERTNAGHRSNEAPGN